LDRFLQDDVMVALLIRPDVVLALLRCGLRFRSWPAS
jgi:hypothetical protein